MMHAAGVMAWFWQIWLAAVVFVFPIPHTIALRNLLLLIGLLVLLATLRNTARPRLLPTMKPAAWGLVATTTWLVLHSLTVAPAPTFALDNLRGDWIVPLLTGALAVYGAARLEPRLAIRAVVAAMLAHMIWVFGWQISLLVANGTLTNLSSGIVPFGERDYQSSLNGFLLAIVLAERIAVLSIGPIAAVFPGRQGWTALLVSFIADLALHTRGGTIVSMTLLLVATVWIARRRRRFILLLIAMAILGGVSFGLDSRWSGMKESLGVGWNSPSLYWLNGEPSARPLTPSGADLEESAYFRAAWAHQALQSISENPLGLGFGRDGFGRAMGDKFGHKGMVSSHSGWLDFAIGAGLPGLALLLITAGLAIHGGWRQFRRHDDAAALMLSFLVGSYLLRCLLDGHLSGWRLGLFAFICGVLIAAMKDSRRPA